MPFRLRLEPREVHAVLGRIPLLLRFPNKTEKTIDSNVLRAENHRDFCRGALTRGPLAGVLTGRSFIGTRFPAG
jgi:hypothetical protein